MTHEAMTDLLQHKLTSDELTSSMLRQQALLQAHFVQQETALIELSRTLNQTSMSGSTAYGAWLLPDVCIDNPLLCLAVVAATVAGDRPRVFFIGEDTPPADVDPDC